MNGSSESFKSKCCRNLYNNKCPDNTPLIPAVRSLLDSSKDFGRQLHGYNNKLAFAATAVENDKGGGFENMKPVSFVTIAGRLNHFIGKQDSLNISSRLGYSCLQNFQFASFKKLLEI